MTDEFHGPELFATVAAVVSPGDQLANRRIIISLDSCAAAGALTQDSTRIPVALLLLKAGGHWLAFKLRAGSKGRHFGPIRQTRPAAEDR